MLRYILLAALLSAAFAACSNQCSGHGTCGSEDTCNCFPRWGGPDCSKRLCQSRPSWVAQTDAEAQKAIGPATGVLGGLHGYAECSSKGKCDSETGECECFEGYTGVACSRQSCPLDCSGHGRCVTNSHASDGYQYENFHVSQFWDAEMTRQCECDRGWTGFACDSRICPVGADPLTCDKQINNPSVQRITLNNMDFGTSSPSDTPLVSISLGFVDMFGGSYTTAPIRIMGSSRSDSWTDLNQYCDEDGEPFFHFDEQVLQQYDSNTIREQLQSIPNFAIPRVNVTDENEYDCQTSTDRDDSSCATMTFDVTFTHAANAGEQQLMSCTISSPYTDQPSVAPRMGSPSIWDSGDADAVAWRDEHYDPTCTVERVEVEDEAVIHVCSNRGICAEDTGICQCFDGYAGEDCSLQNIYF